MAGDTEKTRKLAESLIGSAAMQSAETLAEEGDFELDCYTFDMIAFCCVRCDWWCSQEENNETPGGEWACDDCTPKRKARESLRRKCLKHDHDGISHGATRDLGKRLVQADRRFRL
jgi:hypothetical protein